MAFRTNEDLVRGVIDTNPEKSLKIHIRNANTLTDEIVTEAAAQGITISSGRLELIETYLAAHFYTLEDPWPSRVEVQTGRSRTRYDKGPDWFEMAMKLDPTDTLKGGPRVGIHWLGTPIEET